MQGQRKRLPLEEQKIVHLQVCLTLRDDKLIRDYAKQNNMSAANLARMAILKFISENPIPPNAK